MPMQNRQEYHHAITPRLALNLTIMVSMHFTLAMKFPSHMFNRKKKNIVVNSMHPYIINKHDHRHNIYKIIYLFKP